MTVQMWMAQGWQLSPALIQTFDAKGVVEIQFKHWTSTDHSNLETHILPTEEFVSIFIDKLERLLRHDFIARMQVQYL